MDAKRPNARKLTGLRFNPRARDGREHPLFKGEAGIWFQSTRP